MKLKMKMVVRRGFSKTNSVIKLWVPSEVVLSRNLNEFWDRIRYSNDIRLDKTYSVLIKLRKDNKYFTLDKRQNNIIIRELSDESIDMLYELIQDRSMVILDDYESVLQGSFDAVCIEFYELDIDAALKLKSPFKGMKGVDNQQHNRQFNLISILNDNNIGKKIFMEFKDNILVVKGLGEELMDFKSVFESKLVKGEIKLSPESDVYVNYYFGKPYIIVADRVDGSGLRKRCFNKLGSQILEVVDSKDDKGIITRFNGSSIIKFNDKYDLISKERTINFKSIGRIEGVNKEFVLPNEAFGTFDIETYQDGNLAYCYALGFKTANKVETYYIEEDLDSNKLVLKCINEMLRDKYENITFYAHNLGKFDAVFVIKALVSYNSTVANSDDHQRLILLLEIRM